MIVVGVVITALVSKLKLTLYNESRYIALAVSLVNYLYTILLFCKEDLNNCFTGV
jgi:hypothetical protein